MAQKPVLGKGLASLFPGSAGLDGRVFDTHANIPEQTMQDSGSKDRHPGISHIAIDEIKANHYQPRNVFDEAALEELTRSIESSGIIQPLVVRRLPEGGYELIAGERRLRAAKKAKLKQVPVVIRRSSDQESLEMALIENIQREDLNCVEEAQAYQLLMHEFSLTQEVISKRVGKDRTTIANHLRILKLPEAIIDDLKKKYLSFGHGKAILALESTDLKLEARKAIIEKHLSVRETEDLVERLKIRQSNDGSATSINEENRSNPLELRFKSLSEDLRNEWSTKVEIKGNESKGRIIFYYNTSQELDQLIENMR